MDAVSILFGVGGIMYAIFGIQSGLEQTDGVLAAKITVNEKEISHIRGDIVRVERQAHDADTRVMKQLDELKAGMETIRKESTDSRKDIIDKLDKIIDRELNGPRGGIDR